MEWTFSLHCKGVPEYGQIRKAIYTLIRDLRFKPIGPMHEVVFEGGGATFVQVFAQSHITVSAWPELDYIHIVLCTCDDTELSRLEKLVQSHFGCRIFNSNKI